jgi:SAM-dependent methyltransferase
MQRIGTYRLAAFLSAFLLFQVQPMASKALLPRFGGSYLVWGACMVFFQGVLLLGYAFAHVAQRRMGVLGYSRAHWALLAAPLLCAPFGFGAAGNGPGGGPMVLAVVRDLAVAVGLPLFALSTTSLVLQRWLAQSDLPEARNPYVLYSASNLGSVLGLLSYPALVEPLLGLEAQGRAWWGGYAAMAALHVFILPRRRAGSRAEVPPAGGRVAARDAAAWFLLSAATCALLLAVTNVITFDVASVPLLWILPLCVYLLCFVLAFRQRAWEPAWMRRAMAWTVALGAVLHLMTQLRLEMPPWAALPLHLAVLFVVALNCCGGLARTRPADPGRLTGFYLVVAAGGLAGSLVVSWVVPLASRSLAEYPLALFLACGALALCGGWRQAWVAGRPGWGTAAAVAVAALSVTLVPWAAGRLCGGGSGVGARIAMACCAVPLVLALRAVSGAPAALAAVMLAAAAGMGWTESLAAGASRTMTLRNYYGVYRVFDRDNLRYLQHGTTQHGREYLSGPKAGVPLAYYHPSTPAGRIMACPQFRRERIGMIGLGTGALAAYAGRGQELAIFELDPDNLPIARKQFTHLDTAERNGARLRFEFGDGRVSLGREQTGAFDVFIVDAFNSGSIPVHLLTVEALREYLRVLGPDGVLLLHVSSKMLSLEPVLFSGAVALGVWACQASNETDRDPDAEYTRWVAVTRSEPVRDRLVREMGWRGPDPSARLPRPWTDQYSNIFGAMLAR